MTYVAWPSLRPELTWDGLLTFVGGLLALLAIFYQVRHSDKGLQKQLDAEAQSRRQGERARCRAVATALLFELDNFYRAYIRGLADAIGPKPGDVSGIHYVDSPFLPPLRKVPSDPFPVYKANAGAVGELPLEVTETVVRAYSAAQWVLDRRADYQLAREQSLQYGNEGSHFSFARQSLEELREVFRAAEGTLTQAAKALCKFTGTPFQIPMIASAEAEGPSEGQEPRSSSPAPPVIASRTE